jgi:hypothetical protein
MGVHVFARWFIVVWLALSIVAPIIAGLDAVRFQVREVRGRPERGPNHETLLGNEGVFIESSHICNNNPNISC